MKHVWFTTVILNTPNYSDKKYLRCFFTVVEKAFAHKGITYYWVNTVNGFQFNPPA